MDIKNKAWFSKYQPMILDDLVFDSDEHRILMSKWINEGRIDGNVLFFGPAGVGKTASSEILIRSIITAQNDLFNCDDRSVKEIREKVIPFIKKRPIGNQKIVYIEEIDKISQDAVNVLKKDTMEKHLETCVFIGCTNFIRKIETALQSRFTYKIPFTGTNVDGITKRIQSILQTENIQFDVQNLRDWIHASHKSGIREIINQLQIGAMSANGQPIDFKALKKGASIEENIITLIITIIQTLAKLDPRTKRICVQQPSNSAIANEYQTLYSLVHNNVDINYDVIYSRLYEMTPIIPIKILCGRYIEEWENKKFPHVTLLSFLYDVSNIFIDITG